MKHTVCHLDGLVLQNKEYACSCVLISGQGSWKGLFFMYRSAI